ncbi:peptide/nickel transport system permease protein [Palleronia aestuarii]|uniref:Peptide/nickel transport system permease protein n=1 Tax=Palleronia aestuarii TaxID=568105 RepID=A0A2W7NBU4_9RHOB|nr:ABC transporter permease [Palleronia aestuarii]PZX17093.1 peptide/nickel transport system permease protein [Palleronia aestuarii]
MPIFLVRRFLAAIPVLLTVAVFVFLLLRLTPGDPAAIIAGDMATPEQLERIRATLGLDQPIIVQFGTWIVDILRGDFGTSLISRQPVLNLVTDRMWPTIWIGLITIALSVIIAVPMGVLAAWKQGSWIDHLVMTFSVLGFSVPVFVTGYLLITLFALDLQLFPVQGYTPPSQDFGSFAARVVLPSFTLASIYIALIARMTRASLLNVLGEDYVRTARAKGLTERRVLFRHALRNAAVPVMTVIGTGFALLISGVVVTESVFNIPGLGRLTVDSIFARDYPVIQALILLTAGIYVLVNLLIDISYSFLDPRIRY